MKVKLTVVRISETGKKRFGVLYNGILISRKFETVSSARMYCKKEVETLGGRKCL